LEQLLASWLAHALRIERLLLDALGCLAAANIDARVLKGVALAHTVYSEPSWRIYADADLLVSSDDFDSAVRVLEGGRALERDVPELRQGFDRRFGKEALLRTADGLELDLHRTFVEGALGLTVRLPDLFATPQRFQLGGRCVATLPPAQQLLLAAHTAVLGDWPPRFSALRDVVQVLTTLSPAHSQVLELAERWRARAVLARALTYAWEVLTPASRPSLIGWARSYRPDRLERVLLASHLGPTRAYTRHAAALLVVPGLAGRLAYLSAIAWPQRAYLEARGFGRLRFLGRAAERLRSQARQP
jgi:hypothetical protein